MNKLCNEYINTHAKGEKMKFKNKNLFINASILAIGAATLLSATSALAQDAQQTEQTVIVTATGRAKAVQDIPVSLTAVNAATIQQAGITDVRNLQQVTPSYRVETGQSNAAGTSIAIRGIGTSASNPGFEGAVAVFIDGVYRSRSGSALGELPKVDRIEVINGPNGTLGGRNASAGMVSVFTTKPKFEREIYGKIELGSEGRMGANFGFNDKLSENVAGRLELSANVRDGLIENLNTRKGLNNRNRWFVRGQALWEINEDARFRLILDSAQTNEQCCAGVRYFDGTSAAAVNFIASLSGLVGSPPVNLKGRTVATSPNRPLTENVRDNGVSGEFNLDLGDMKFSSITAYRVWDTTRGQDIDFSGIDRAYREGFALGFDTFTQEFRLNGSAGKVDWLVGAYYSNEKTEYRDTVRFGTDAARYVDALAMGTDINGPAAGGTGFTIFRSLGTGSGMLFQAALTPGLIAPIANALCAATPTPACVTAVTPTATVIAGNVAGGYANALAAAAPQPGDGQQNELAEVDSSSASIFTHNLIDLTDNDTLTLGLRYNSDEKVVKANLNARAAACGVLQSTAQVIAGVPVTYNQLTQTIEGTPLAAFAVLSCNPVLNTVANGAYGGKRTETAWNGVVSLSHDFSRELMVYGTYSRGYKSGGYNLDRSAFKIKPSSTAKPSIVDWEFKPEFVDNLEVGVKWEGLPGRTTLNGAIFQENITDFQYNAFNGFNFQNINIPGLISRGLELDLTSRPAPGLVLRGGLLLNDVYVDGAYTAPGFTIDDGKKLPGVSDTVLTGSIGYKAGIGDSNLDWTFYIDTRYESGYSRQTLNATVVGPVDNQDAYTVTNARVGFGSKTGTWALEGWVRNLSDTYFLPVIFGVPEQNNIAGYPGEPRTYGVTLRADF